MSRPWHFVAAVAMLAACTSDDGTSSVAPQTTTSLAPTVAAPTPVGVARTESAVLSDVPYADESPTQVVDLYLPANDGAMAVPVVVLLHPGGFHIGGEDGYAGFGADLNTRGFAAVAVRYRLSGEALFPAGAQDVKAVVRWLRAHATEFGLDPARIVAWGYSAGGWMAAMLGVTGDQPTVFDDPLGPAPDQSAAVLAVISFYGEYDFATADAQSAEVAACTGTPATHGHTGSYESLWLGEAVSESELTPLTNLSAYAATATHLPAFFLEHGDVDCVVPVGQVRQFAAALDAAGASVTLNIEPGYTHGDPRFDEAPLDAALQFLEEVTQVS